MKRQKSTGFELAKRWLVVGALLSVGIIVGAIATITIQNNQKQAKQEKYSLLADRILQGSNKDRTISFTALREQLAGYVDTSLKDKKYSIYFEYLPTGTSVGFNESDTLVGASLLKVPFAVQYYRALENGELNRDDTVTLTAAQLDSSYGDLYKKGAGYTLTLQEVVDIMLIKSDNTALRALADVLAEKSGYDTIQKIFNFVDLNYASDQQGGTLIGAESYSSILKCLYFSCYISKDNSQEVLNLLSSSDFNNRLKRYISEDEMPIVAHKIGSFSNAQSDCGIFYQPRKPYILCVMIEGDDEAASQQIGKISVMVHEYIANQIQ